MEKIMCSICTDRLFDMDFIVSTACCHIFHEMCINQWLSKASTCPECRKDCTKEPNRRLFFNAEPCPDYVEKETFQKKIIELKNELITQKKSFEEALSCEMETRKEMHEENKKLKGRIQELEKSQKVVVSTKFAKSQGAPVDDLTVIEILD